MAMTPGPWLPQRTAQMAPPVNNFWSKESAINFLRLSARFELEKRAGLHPGFCMMPVRMIIPPLRPQRQAFLSYLPNQLIPPAPRISERNDFLETLQNRINEYNFQVMEVEAGRGRRDARSIEILQNLHEQLRLSIESFSNVRISQGDLAEVFSELERHLNGGGELQLNLRYYPRLYCAGHGYVEQQNNANAILKPPNFGLLALLPWLPRRPPPAATLPAKTTHEDLNVQYSSQPAPTPLIERKISKKKANTRKRSKGTQVKDTIAAPPAQVLTHAPWHPSEPPQAATVSGNINIFEDMNEASSSRPERVPPSDVDPSNIIVSSRKRKSKDTTQEKAVGGRRSLRIQAKIQKF